MKLRGAAVGALVVAALALPQGAGAQPAEGPGAAAFARRDFAAAAEIWREEADTGSARAKLGLGLLNDLGLGMPRDAAKALRWYLEAAEAGVPEAQFNVAVMLDAGTGVPRDTVGAAVWYARAAVNGHHRGEYNIGLLYESGEGVQRNPDLARFWLGRAAGALPAAAERLAALGPARPDERRLAPPELLAAGIVGDGDADRAELVWSAGPGPPDARFLVELARLPAGSETWGAILVSRSTEASAVAERLRHGDADYAWRVTLVDGPAARYAASPWQLVGNAARPDAPAGLPEGRITLRVAPDDAPAHRLARELTASFRDAGLWVRVLPDGDAPTGSGVRYGFAEDATLAGMVAEFLPVLHRDDAVLSPGLDAAPGEIMVRLVGGPAERRRPDRPATEPRASSSR